MPSWLDEGRSVLDRRPGFGWLGEGCPSPSFSTKGVLIGLRWSEMELNSRNQNVDSPEDRLDQEAVHRELRRTKKDYPKNGSQPSRVHLHRKMSCPSLSHQRVPQNSVPVPQPITRRRATERKKVRPTVCDGCYPWEGNPIFPNVAMPGSKVPLDPPTARTGIECPACPSMISAIEDFARNQHLGEVSDSIGTRLVLELGIQRRGQLMFSRAPPMSARPRTCPSGQSSPNPVLPTPRMAGCSRSSGGAVCGFFRIHDSR